MSVPVPIVFALATAVVNAYATTPVSAPTDLELRSAYCLKVREAQLQAVSSELEADLRALPEVQEMLHRDKDDIHRLRSYLLPRLDYLDSAALLAAASRGEADFRQSAIQGAKCAESRTCPKQPSQLEKWGACIESCRQVHPVTARVDSCKDLSWLPF